MTQLVILALRSSLLFVGLISTSRSNATVLLLDWTEATTGKEFTEVLQLAALTMLISEIGLTAFAVSQLRVRPPTPLQLVSRPIVANGGLGKSAYAGSDALLTSLSLDDRPPRASFAFGQANGLDKSIFDPHTEDSNVGPPVQRDADGDAVIEDAATYSARRMSVSSDDEWEHTQIPSAATSSWSSTWPKPAAQPAFQSSSTATPLSTVPGGATRSTTAFSNFQLGPQRFWEPQNPTGLEDVFGRAVSLDDTPQRRSDADASDGKWRKWFGFS